MALSILRNNLKRNIFNARFPTTVESNLLNRFEHTTPDQPVILAILQDVYGMLRRAASNEEISKPIFTVRESNRNAAGYLGDQFYFTIHDEKSDRREDVIVKKAYRSESVRSSIPLEELYSNEYTFYERIWPAFSRFQENALEASALLKIPKCYATNIEKNKEAIVLEDLFCSGFESVHRGRFFDKDHFKLLFSNYGKLHGLSFAYKSTFPKNFHDMYPGLYDFWAGLKNVQVLANSVRFVLKQCSENLELESETGMRKKFEEYVQDGVQKFSKSAAYTGDHAVILHGNTWSDKVMFKYNEERQPIDIRIVDFQMSKLGNPIHDLSYCFYSGGTPEVFESLDYYLGVYHHSLSKTLERFKFDPAKIYPYEMLEKEWKNHCKFGFVASLLILMEKSLYDTKGMSILDIISSDGRIEAEGKYDQNAYRERCLELIKHMYTKGFL